MGKVHEVTAYECDKRWLAKQGNREKRRAYMAAWNARPENKAKRALYIKTRRAKQKLARALARPDDLPLQVDGVPLVRGFRLVYSAGDGKSNGTYRVAA